MFPARLIASFEDYVLSREGKQKNKRVYMTTPPYGFPGFMPTFDEEGARVFLLKQGFPEGFAELIINQSEKIAHRFFVSTHRFH